MTEAEWMACEEIGAPLRFLKPDARRWRLFAVGCCMWDWDLLTEDRSREAIRVAERFADGDATAEELATTWENAGEVRGRQIDEDHDRRWHRVHTGAWATAHQEAQRAALLAFTCSNGSAALTLEETEEIPAHERFPLLCRKKMNLLRDIFGNPFRPVIFDAEWRSDTALSLAQHIYRSRDFSVMPILADALQDAGCENKDVLKHCRDASGIHARGCWVVDAVLGK